MTLRLSSRVAVFFLKKVKKNLLYQNKVVYLYSERGEERSSTYLLKHLKKHNIMAKFNKVAYQSKIDAQIEELKNKLSNTVGFFAKQEIEDEIKDLEVIREPKYANHCLYSDIHAYEVLEMVTENSMKVRRLRAERTDNNGMSESQEYEYTPNESASIITIRRHKNGKWYEPKSCSPFVISNEPDEYYDFSF